MKNKNICIGYKDNKRHYFSDVTIKESSILKGFIDILGEDNKIESVINKEAIVFIDFDIIIPNTAEIVYKE